MFLRKHKKKYSSFQSFLNIEMPNVAEILPRKKQSHVCPV